MHAARMYLYTCAHAHKCTYALAAYLYVCTGTHVCKCFYTHGTCMYPSEVRVRGARHACHTYAHTDAWKGAPYTRQTLVDVQMSAHM